jgi:hypothetical protein
MSSKPAMPVDALAGPLAAEGRIDFMSFPLGSIFHASATMADGGAHPHHRLQLA